MMNQWLILKQEGKGIDKYLKKCGYSTVAVYGIIFQKIPYFNSGDAHILQKKLGEAYDEKEWQIIRSAFGAQKLTYKNKYIQGDI